jgi:RecJ-like exonuclease
MNTKRIAYFITVLVFGLLLVACERTRIGDITSDPGRFMNKEVSVAGHVTQSIGFLGKGIYQVDDGTGKLWVLAENRGVPSKGAMVGVKGRVTPTVTFMGINYATVMRESDRRAAKSEPTT